jgi:hypothetical protein
MVISQGLFLECPSVSVCGAWLVFYVNTVTKNATTVYIACSNCLRLNRRCNFRIRFGGRREPQPLSLSEAIRTMGPRFHLPAVRYDYQAKDQLRHRFGPDNSHAWIASANIVIVLTLPAGHAESLRKPKVTNVIRAGPVVLSFPLEMINHSLHTTVRERTRITVFT